MGSQCFYEVLGLSRGASTAEIRAAFRRCALQTHPDKGGSKEAFHLIYQAFSNLVCDNCRLKPAAWTSHQAEDRDDEVAQTSKPKRCTGIKGRVDRRSPVVTPTKSHNISTHDEEARKQKRKKSTMTTSADGCDAQERPAPKECGSAHFSGLADPPIVPDSSARRYRGILLSSLRKLLNNLSKAARREVLRHRFSQQQRLDLLAWAESNLHGTSEGGKHVSTAEDSELESDNSDDDLPGYPALDDTNMPSESEESSSDSEPTTQMFALCDTSPHLSECQVPSRCVDACASGESGCQHLPSSKNFTAVRGISTMKYRTGYQTYRVNVSFDNVAVYARDVSDLTVALDTLVILTTIKQHVSRNKSERMPVRLREAVHRTLQEFDRSAEELGLTFAVVCRHGFWVGRRQLSTPRLPNVDAAIAAWESLSPYFMLQGCGHNHPIWSVGFVELKARWKRFKEEFVEICACVGAEREGTWKKLQTLEEASTFRRERVLLFWERKHMRMADGRRGYKGRQQLSPEIKDQRGILKIDRVMTRWRMLDAREVIAEKKRAAAKAKALAQQRRRESREKDKRWRQMMSKDLTMDDIFAATFCSPIPEKSAFHSA